MSVPGIEFPVPFEDIPKAVATLTNIILAREADINVATAMLRLAREGCEHKDAKRGHNERDGDWMNPCPHCGASE